MYAEHSLGVNMNVWWGAALAAFGLVMLALARLRRKQQPRSG
jgi:predicted MFS family arabinose efflux permease